MVISMWLREQFYFFILMRKEEHCCIATISLDHGQLIRPGCLQEVPGLIRNPSVVSVTAVLQGRELEEQREPNPPPSTV